MPTSHLQSSQTGVYFKNGQIVNHDKTFQADIYIEDGLIKFVGHPSEIKVPGGVRVIDAAGKLIIPGGVDPNTHFQAKYDGIMTIDDFYTGTKAAVAGGTTTIIDFVMPEKGESLVEAYEKWRSMADAKVCCDYALHVGLTWWSKSVSDEMKILCDELGINSFQMYMAFKDIYQLKDSEMLEALERIRSLGALAQVHAENGDLIAKNVSKLLAFGVTGPEGHEMSRHEEVEAEAVHRACVFAHQMKAPLYVTRVTSASAAKVLGRARRGGYCVFGETLASSIGRTMHGVPQEELLYYITSPPIRGTPETPRVLMQALAYDDLQVTGSDNTTFTKEDKERGSNDFSRIPNGVNGVEDRMSVVWEKGVHSGLLDPCRYVAITSTNAAKIFNLYPQKGRIAVGSDADLVIWNPHKNRTISKDTHYHKTDFNIFEGMKCHGVPEMVFVRGRICVENKLVHVAEGFGRFLNTPVRSPYVYDVLEGKTSIYNDLNGEGSSFEKYLHDGQTMDDVEVGKPDHESPAVRAAAGGSHSTTPTGVGHVTGSKNMQDSTFSISEEMDPKINRTSVGHLNNPADKSSIFW